MKKVIVITSCIFLIAVFVIIAAMTGNSRDVDWSAGFQKFVESDVNQGYQISLMDNVVNVMHEDEKYTLNYDVTDNPTFTYEFLVEKGMSYEAYEKLDSNIDLPKLGYFVFANAQGIDFYDARTYYYEEYMEDLWNESSSFIPHTVIDDLRFAEGVTMVNKSDNSTTIYTSEFPEKAIEYMDILHPDTIKISDSEDVNSFTMTIERVDLTETSCKIISKLVINKNANFSKILKSNDDIEINISGSTTL